MNESTPAYTAQIAGSTTKWQSNFSRDSIVGRAGNFNADENTFNYDYSKAMKVTTSTTTDDGTTSQTTTDYSNYGDTIKTLSKTLANTDATGTAAENNGSGKQSLNGITRKKYNNTENATNGATYSFTFNGGAEKVITFKGDNTSLMQVFTLDSSMLSGDQGISFEFVDIPENASVVINVKGENVSFHNGWRVWWNGTDVSDGYRTDADQTTRDAYSKAAQSIIWNFSEASNVTIYGGQGTGTLTISGINNATDKNATSNGTYTATTTDDPAAALLGSVLVPNGSFESHVSTNGRVWVGEDFLMYNPESSRVTLNNNSQWYLQGTDGYTTSVLDMDQERHNLPWNGSLTSECSAIQWNKVDSTDTTKKLAGSSWAIYSTLEGAKSSDSAALLTTVTDNAGSDLNSADGVLQIGRLSPEANYYIKEISAPDGYQADTSTIYRIYTSLKGDTPNTTVTRVWHNNASDNTVMTDGNIPNSQSGASIAWQKNAEGDTSELLSGSEWTLTKQGSASGDAGQSWTVKDNTATVSAVVLKKSDGTTLNASDTLELQQNSDLDLTAEVTSDSEDTPVQDVTWKSGDSTVAVVVGDGRVVGIGGGETTITACSVSDTSKCASVNVKVTAQNVNTLTVTNNGTELNSNSSISLTVGGNTTLDVTVAPSTVPYSFTSSDTSVATVSESGVITALKAGSTTITVTAGDKSVSFTVNVAKAEPTTTTVYFNTTSTNWNYQETYLYYQTNSGVWTFKKMSQACNGYLSVDIEEKATQGHSFLFASTNNTNTAKWYKAYGEVDFTFTGGLIERVELSNNVLQTAPSCFATNSRSAAKSRKMTANSGTATASDEAGIATASDDATADDTANSTEQTLQDMDPGVGKFRVDNLADGTYTLAEKTAPDGYLLNTNVYTFTVTGGKVEWTGNNKPSMVEGTAAISDPPTKVSWDKVDSEDDSKLLVGAQWKLTGPAAGDNDGEVYCIVDGNGHIAKDDNGNDTCQGVTLTDSSNKDASGAVVNTADGKITVTGLKHGTYTLVETVAPDGYELSTQQYTFEITQDGDTTVEITPVTSTETTESGTSATKATTRATKTTTNTIPNTHKPGSITVGKYFDESKGTPNTDAKFEFTSTLTPKSGTAKSKYPVTLYSYAKGENDTVPSGTYAELSNVSITTADSTVTVKVGSGDSAALVLTCDTATCSVEGDKLYIAFAADSGSDSASTYTAKLSLAPGYAYKIGGLAMGDKVAVQETNIPGGVEQSDIASGNGNTAAGQQSKCEVDANSSVATCTVSEWDAELRVVATNVMKQYPLPGTGMFGGTWVYLAAGMAALIGGGAVVARAGSRGDRRVRNSQ